ncbi:hydrogenase formation protein HypD [Halomonas denitrificans]|uniref:hydrogenase formation protein HypD n=1 Tax=Halomonas TaxID=2745 RepID=UPI001A8FBE53|nr:MULTISPECIES: hydrogenase formation protein HypD [Halomonas]MBN8413575.1 hydrogenase formation protein HypD [Halomonas litopenaei]MCA0973129.1 hydrogenase formation protein HypD [Halomonas denitrificans]
MKFIDEFRDHTRARQTLEHITTLVERICRDRAAPLRIMEVCGGHTHAIFHYGLEAMLPKQLELIHGPGCPVCVLPMGRVDDCLAIAERPEVILATFGDAIRVPGSRKSLLQAKAEGADVRIVYSPMDALDLAIRHPEREVVFFGLGFETTIPSTALTITQAQRQRITNFSVFCNHITIIPTLKAILENPDHRLDGFLGPGHVSMIIGTEPYRFIAEHYRCPVVISGFEPLDMLQSLLMVVRQLHDGRAEVENQYQRLVSRDGNPAALQAVHEVYESRQSCEWRGLGPIEDSGMQIRQAYAAYDAERKFSLPNQQVADPEALRCGEVLTGNLKPWQCELFGSQCSPESPCGALMVSSEGACAAYFQYGGPRAEQHEEVSP